MGYGVRSSLLLPLGPCGVVCSIVRICSPKLEFGETWLSEMDRKWHGTVLFCAF